MSPMAFQITSRKIFTQLFNQTQIKRKNQSPASLAFVWGIHRRPVNSLHKGTLARFFFIWWRHHEEAYHQGGAPFYSVYEFITKLYENSLPLILILLIKLCHNLVHVMIAQLSWHVVVSGKCHRYFGKSDKASQATQAKMLDTLMILCSFFIPATQHSSWNISNISEIIIT